MIFSCDSFIKLLLVEPRLSGGGARGVGGSDIFKYSNTHIGCTRVNGAINLLKKVAPKP